MSNEQFDLVVIGSGPGGYTGAIRGAQLGLKTAIVEKNSTLGGTCLNIGCIPSKALLDSSEYYHQTTHEFAEHGIQVEGVKLDMKAMQDRKNKIVKDLTGGVKYLMDKNKIQVFHGLGKIADANTVTVTGEDGKDTSLSAKNIMLATGSDVVELPFMPFDGTNVISSTEALELDKPPEHLVVIGAGAIGLEMGSVWLRLGSKVTVIEFADKICGPMDAQMSKALMRVLKKQGMEFHLSSKVTGAKVGKKTHKVLFEGTKDQKQHEIECDKILVSVGRKPYSEGLGLENVGLKTDDRGRVPVNEKLQTSVPNIFAIGDLIDGPMLAHKAEEEGVAVAEYLVNGYGHVNYSTVPWVIYTWPEVAGVGKTEEELKAAGVEYLSGSFPFSANGRAKAMGTTDGMVKVLAEKSSDRVVGVHIVGPRASDVLAEAVIAMEFGASSEDIGRSFHGHPTLSEVMREAALAVEKRARQM